MSTILKALKKLEREKEALRAPGPVPVVRTPSLARSGLSGWLLKPWLLWALAGFIIVVLGGTTWHFYRQSRVYTPRLAERSDTMDHPAVRRPADAPKAAVSPSNRDAVKPKPPRPDRSSRPSQLPAGRQPAVRQTHPKETGDHGRPEQFAESSVSKTFGPSPAQEKPAVRQPTPAVVPAGHPNSAVKRPTPERKPAVEFPAAVKKGEKVETAPAVSAAQPDAEPKRMSPSDVYEKTPPLTDGRLRVHAIAWSQQPAERMAVINSRVVHEGDSVEDFVIVVIRPDDVVVREKEKGVWRVEFGRP